MQLHMIKEARAHGVVTPLTLTPHRLKVNQNLAAFVAIVAPQSPISFSLFTSIHGVFLFLILYRKPQHEQRKEQEPKRPHIKKPLNAFMLYMKEMRANVVAECTLKESAAINQILGRRVGGTGRSLFCGLSLLIWFNHSPSCGSTPTAFTGPISLRSTKISPCINIQLFVN